MTKAIDAPALDQFEVSIFGPGYGECVVVHYGNGRWFVIDSCIDPSNRRPAALNYFEQIGVDPSTAVAVVAATHWHDDHVRGLAEVYGACSNALFSCSAALRSQEFIALGTFYEELSVGMPAGPSELARVFQLVQERKAPGYKPIRWTQSDQILYRETLLVGENQVHVALSSLSPSDEMMTRAMSDIAAMWAAVNKSSVARLVEARPNHVSVAMQLQIAQRSILLGSDLEETGDPLIGWSAVLASKGKPETISEAYKVAHHASHTGHHGDVWSMMLSEQPLAMITPFRLGRHRIPTKDDQQRICALTSRAYITADPTADHAPKRRAPKVEGLIRATTRSRRIAEPVIGHIRWRGPITDFASVGEVDLFGSASKLAA